VIAFALVTGAGTLAAGTLLALALRRLPTVRMQLAGLALLAVGLPLAAVILGGLVMFHMHDDVKILAVAAASASTALGAALLVGSQIARRLHGLETAAEEVSGGELGARAPAGGPREFAHVGSAFNTMAGNLEALFDARRQLVAWASHDLRAPIASIQAMLDAIDDRLATTDEYLPALREQTRTLAGLVDDLFELASIDAGALTLELRAAELPALVSGCVSGLEAEARSRRVRLSSELEEPLPLVRCAPEHVQRVLYNLLTNALRHTPSDGSIVVRARAHARELEVSVEDTGAGLSVEAQRRVFERFWRGDAARTPAPVRARASNDRTSVDGVLAHFEDARRGGENGDRPALIRQSGAGMGLAIARGLIEAQGGRIWVENLPDGGARFAFTLPIAEREPAIA
jgi:signal transduction histidine kinase